MTAEYSAQSDLFAVSAVSVDPVSTFVMTAEYSASPLDSYLP
jgi:hypothetical protein